MKRQHFLLLFLSIALAGFFIAHITYSAQSIMCPKVIVVNQKLAKTENNWETFQEDISIRLMSITIFDGHPKQQAAIVPDMETNKKGRRVCTWRLIPNKIRNYWIGCSYDRTNIMLIRPLDRDISICEVTYDTRVSIGGHPSVIEVRFK